MTWFGIDAAAFLLALLFALCLTPLFGKLALKLGIMDVPKSEQHKLHGKATPLLGGCALFAAWALSGGTGLVLMHLFSGAHFQGNVQAEFLSVLNLSRELTVMVLCALAAVLLGLFDDCRSMKAWQKLLGQIAIACCAAAWGGAGITLFIPNAFLSFAVTAFWFVLIFNAINFFDNMDGLAAGTGAIAFLLFTAAAAINGQYFVALLGSLSAGAACGFWFYNRTPARIFMGDSGSHLLAFLLAYISIRVTYYTPGLTSTRFSVLIPLFILAVPLLDALTVVLIRLYHHKPVYVGDHNHISHRFLHMGLSRAQSVIMVHLLVLITGLGSLGLLRGDTQTCLLLLLQGVALYLMICFLQYAVVKGREQ